MKYEILKYRPELKDQILQLQTHLWSPDLALNAAYFEWKYLQNPYSDVPLISVALYDGQVVGMRGMMGAAWQRGLASPVELCPCAADVVIAPQHRNRGLFPVLTRAALQDAADRGLHLALIELPSTLVATWLPEISVNSDTVTCLRSVLMKPEHANWLDEIVAILESARVM